MKISISNMYFSSIINEKMLLDLVESDVKAIELAPFHQFKSYKIGPEILRFNELMVSLNLQVSGVQGFTYFDKPNDMINNFFSNNNSWKNHLIDVLELTLILGCKTMVFGAPSYRLDYKMAQNFENSFLDAVETARTYGIDLLLEAVPKTYGCEILNTIQEVIDFNVRHNLKHHFDTGCYFNENSEQIKAPFWPELNFDHIHISTRDLTVCRNSQRLKTNLSKLLSDQKVVEYFILETTVKSHDMDDAISDVKFLKEMLT